MKLTQWLQVLDGTNSNLGGNGTLFFRRIETGFIPEPGVDDVVLWTNIDEKNVSKEWDGPLWQVKRRYMDNIGDWHIELTKIVVDPNQMWQDTIAARIGTGRKVIYESPWWTSIDGDPILELERAGWQRR